MKYTDNIFNNEKDLTIFEEKENLLKKKKKRFSMKKKKKENLKIILI